MRIDIRSVRYLTVTPMKVNFPCIHSVAEIHRDSTVKKTKVRSLGQRIYLSSRPKEPSATILEKVRLRWNVENKNNIPATPPSLKTSVDVELGTPPPISHCCEVPSS